MNVALPLILLCVLLNSVAQLLLKEAMNRIGHFTFSLTHIIPIGIQVATNPFFMAGLICYVFSLVVWLLVLSRIDVSIAFPLNSISFIVCAFGAYIWLGESLSFMRIVGIVVIMTGVLLVTNS
jgi:multidrug transporter EmrE-like cation transporter